MTYYLVFSSLLLARLLDTGRRMIGFYWAVLIALYLFSALRFEVGCDWPNYILNYEMQKPASYEDAFASSNPAHWVVLETMDRLGLDYVWLNIVTSAIFFAGLHAVARRSPAPLAVLALAFPVLILNMPMAAVKQAAAIGLICFALNAFIDGRIVRFGLFVVLAACFHGSAAVFILLAPFVLGRYSFRNIALAGILAVPGVFALLATEAAEVANTRYIAGDMDAGGAIFRVGLLVATGLFYTVFLSSRWKVALPRSHKLISLLALGMIALGVLLPLSSVIADRFGYYFAVPQVLIYAAVPWLYPRGRGALVALAPYAAMTVLFLAWTLLSSHYARCYVPYGVI
ncbi:EpsG family protein [Roseobacter sp. HKCCA0434]|uniref:EpsG family protein n=1 Tax=Roseobacter sp. HKCCA0434 TaxID=3079297 RepID=UPI0029059FE0|nr:EpsG family protein [Roseobacter sp. HKCCA0434]